MEVCEVQSSWNRDLYLLGQGTWYALSHRPDKIIAAAPVSAYSSIQGKGTVSCVLLALTVSAYVPYHLWHEADPLVTSIVHASMNTYRHELLVENFGGIPVLQQHGGADDNVPVYHSRRLNQLISQAGGSSRYVELQGAGHWFDGVMTTRPLREFYEYHLDRRRASPELPIQFSIMVANPGDMGSRGGIVVDQLISPERYGKIHVTRFPSSSIWVLKTSNILRFHLSRLHPVDIRLRFDDSPDLFLMDRTQQDENCFRRLTNGSWQVGSMFPR